VASFLGVSNLIDGRLGAKEGGMATVETHDGARLRLPANRVGPHVSDAIRVGVRPEKISLVPVNGARPEGNALRGTVVVAAFLGVSIQYLVRAAGGEELTVLAQNHDGSEPDSLGPGREVQAWSPEHTFVVAKETHT
jgi:spermidine/putrescine transport system ATP-binding protein